MTNRLSIGIVGGGNMGEPIINNLSKNYQVAVCEADKIKSARLRRRYGVATLDLKTLIAQSPVIILCVKPQSFPALLKEMRLIGLESQLIISIAAGIKTSTIEKLLGEQGRVIRTMPNLPAQIGKGITAVAKGKKATVKDFKLAKEIFNFVGEVVGVDEKDIDTVTAISGSGPAYVFLFVEHYMKAARALGGLPPKMVDQLVLETIKGSIAVIDTTKIDPKSLRAQVTSKKGTTEAAIKEFSKGKMDKVFKDALAAAKKRAKQLSQ
ncbi:pyrroline-5-carboxylate reductase [Candidatus Omnitrophota bacterium]